jgi:hypothetical protein
MMDWLGPRPRHKLQRRKYQPLVEWLQALPASQQHATLSLTAIAQLIGHSLPPSARSHGYWGGHSTRLYWHPIGFQARFSRADGGSVIFTRVQTS